MMKKFKNLLKWTGIVIGVYLLISSAFLVAQSMQKSSFEQDDKSVANAETLSDQPTVEQLWKLTNAERTKRGLKSLPLDDRLNKSAQAKADDETKYNYFGHVSKNDGKHGITFIFKEWPGCAVGSENLVENLSTTNEATQEITALMHSPAHKAAILNPKAIAIGFGITDKQVVQHFCFSK